MPPSPLARWGRVYPTTDKKAARNNLFSCVLLFVPDKLFQHPPNFAAQFFVFQGVIIRTLLIYIPGILVGAQLEQCDDNIVICISRCNMQYGNVLVIARIYGIPVFFAIAMTFFQLSS